MPRPRPSAGGAMHGSTQPLDRWGRCAGRRGRSPSSSSGCSRQHFRERADKDVDGVITQKNVFPDWKVENWHVYPDPRARFADPPGAPGPPAVPAGRLRRLGRLAEPPAPRPRRHRPVRGDGYLDCIAALGRREPGRGRRRGQREKERQKGTEIAGPKADSPTRSRRRAELAGPHGQGRLARPGTRGRRRRVGQLRPGRSPARTRPFRLRLEQAVELALFNSREFQDRREDLYLAALPVTLERYSFAAQAFAAEQIIRESIGRDVARRRRRAAGGSTPTPGSAACSPPGPNCSSGSPTRSSSTCPAAEPADAASRT